MKLHKILPFLLSILFFCCIPNQTQAQYVISCGCESACNEIPCGIDFASGDNSGTAIANGSYTLPVGPDITFQDISAIPADDVFQNIQITVYDGFATYTTSITDPGGTATVADGDGGLNFSSETITVEYFIHTDNCTGKRCLFQIENENIDPCTDVECPEGEVCEDGTCIDPCDDLECMDGFICVEGECIDPCEDVECPEGEICELGECIDPCEDVKCPEGQICELGECIDPCEDVVCEDDIECVDGICCVYELNTTKVADIEEYNSQTGAEDITYTITVENTGNCTVTNIEVIDTKPAQTTYVSDADVGGVGGFTDSGEATWNVGVLQPGEIATFEVVVNTEDTAQEDLVNAVTTTSEEAPDDSAASIIPDQPCEGCIDLFASDNTTPSGGEGYGLEVITDGGDGALVPNATYLIHSSNVNWTLSSYTYCGETCEVDEEFLAADNANFVALAKNFAAYFDSAGIPMIFGKSGHAPADPMFANHWYFYTQCSDCEDFTFTTISDGGTEVLVTFTKNENIKTCDDASTYLDISDYDCPGSCDACVVNILDHLSSNEIIYTGSGEQPAETLTLDCKGEYYIQPVGCDGEPGTILENTVRIFNATGTFLGTVSANGWGILNLSQITALEAGSYNITWQVEGCDSQSIKVALECAEACCDYSIVKEDQSTPFETNEDGILVLPCDSIIVVRALECEGGGVTQLTGATLVDENSYTATINASGNAVFDFTGTNAEAQSYLLTVSAEGCDDQLQKVVIECPVKSIAHINASDVDENGVTQIDFEFEKDDGTPIGCGEPVEIPHYLEDGNLWEIMSGFTCDPISNWTSTVSGDSSLLFWSVQTDVIQNGSTIQTNKKGFAEAMGFIYAAIGDSPINGNTPIPNTSNLDDRTFAQELLLEIYVGSIDGSTDCPRSDNADNFTTINKVYTIYDARSYTNLTTQSPNFASCSQSNNGTSRVISRGTSLYPMDVLPSHATQSNITGLTLINTCSMPSSAVGQTHRFETAEMDIGNPNEWTINDWHLFTFDFTLPNGLRAFNENLGYYGYTGGGTVSSFGDFSIFTQQPTQTPLCTNDWSDFRFIATRQGPNGDQSSNDPSGGPDLTQSCLAVEFSATLRGVTTVYSFVGNSGTTVDLPIVFTPQVAELIDVTFTSSDDCGHTVNSLMQVEYNAKY